MDIAMLSSKTRLTKKGARSTLGLRMSASSPFDSTRSSEPASSFGLDVGSVVFVVSSALGLISSGAAAS